ncbi:hypothetical protein PsorP6_010076 [Peronosclerospora sorghi]|uniref:Uncharacterized protein n=1 Tax=Peronosclerospora sorghi TaxID=230839 RepID=A0ACC0VVG5_9STRA|nr:hypothetical protein PsorP6_010076 [Peronosclerospora sorghi]
MTPTEGNRTYAIIVCIFASLGGFFFGYDQGVTGVVLVMESYDGGLFTSNRTIAATLGRLHASYNMTYNIGCMVGAIMGGWIADRFGRRLTIFHAGSLFCLGTAWLTFCPSQIHTSLLIARFIQGMGGAEIAPKELRGFLSGFMHMTVVTGLLCANIVNQLIASEGGESLTGLPWWHLSSQTKKVGREVRAIGAQIAREGRPGGYKELMEPSSLKRVIIAMLLQDVLGNGILSVLIISIINFISTIPAMRWVDTYERRQFLLIGAVGMVISHLVSAILFTLGCNGNTEMAGFSKTSGYAIIVATSLFVFNFAISWGPVCWIYLAEIFQLNIRSMVVSLSTMANWLMGVVMTWVVKLFPSLNINGVFFLLASTSILSGMFVYFKCPETAGILLEDIESLFNGIARHKNSPKAEETHFQPMQTCPAPI